MAKKTRKVTPSKANKAEIMPGSIPTVRSGTVGQPPAVQPSAMGNPPAAQAARPGTPPQTAPAQVGQPPMAAAAQVGNIPMAAAAQPGAIPQAGVAQLGTAAGIPNNIQNQQAVTPANSYDPSVGNFETPVNAAGKYERTGAEQLQMEKQKRSRSVKGVKGPGSATQESPTPTFNFYLGQNPFQN